MAAAGLVDSEFAAEVDVDHADYIEFPSEKPAVDVSPLFCVVVHVFGFQPEYGPKPGIDVIECRCAVDDELVDAHLQREAVGSAIHDVDGVAIAQLAADILSSRPDLEEDRSLSDCGMLVRQISIPLHEMRPIPAFRIPSDTSTIAVQRS